MESTTSSADASTVAPGRWRRWLGRLKIGLVTLFVVWHLFFLVFRGILDLWYEPFTSWMEEQTTSASREPGENKRDGRQPAAAPALARLWTATWRAVHPIFKRLDRVTTRYANFLGIEQGWRLFSGPMARSAPFLTARIEFTDGSAAWVYSENEPNPHRFFRVGGWRQRKLEDYLAINVPGDFEESRDLPVWSAFARGYLSRWQNAHPDDGRKPARIVLLTRSIKFPEPCEDPCTQKEPEITTLVVFDPDGRLP